MKYECDWMGEIRESRKTVSGHFGSSVNHGEGGLFVFKGKRSMAGGHESQDAKPPMLPKALPAATRLCLVGVGFRKAQDRPNAVYFVAIGRIDRLPLLKNV
jgi:hypothetical protein